MNTSRITITEPADEGPDGWCGRVVRPTLMGTYSRATRCQPIAPNRQTRSRRSPGAIAGEDSDRSRWW